MGTVGSAVAEILLNQADSLARRLGARLVLRKVAIKDPHKKRLLELSREQMASSVEALIADPSVDIVVELIGGTDAARVAVIKALENDKQVVSANKALIAAHGEEIFKIARERQRDFFFEAAVCGGIPILRVLREAYVGVRITGLMGIVNGTCNFILTAMRDAYERGEAVDFDDVLKQAQDKGYAEADPAMDIDGTDAAQKLAILASLAYGGWIDYKKIHKEGISHLKLVDIEMADEFGYQVKLLAIAKQAPSGEGLDLRVHPTLLPKSRLLATVKGVFNAVYVTGEPLGPSLLHGKGAGGGPTATAVVADIVDVARNLLTQSAARVPVLSYSAPQFEKLRLADMKNLQRQYYVRTTVVDRPGVLAAITKVLGEHNVSIASLVQKDRGRQAPVSVVMLTHEAKEKDMRGAISAIDALDVVVDRSVLIRVED